MKKEEPVIEYHTDNFLFSNVTRKETNEPQKEQKDSKDKSSK